MNSAYRIVVAALLLSVIWLIVRRQRVSLSELSLDNVLPLRGLLALLVVIGHCDLIHGGSVVLELLHLSTPAVAVFFFLSGYGMMKSLMVKGDAYRQGILIRSAIKLFVPVAVALGIWLMYAVCSGRAIGIGDGVYDSFATGKLPPPHSWYVWALYGLYVIFYSVMCLKFRTGIVTLFVIIAFWYAVLRFGLAWNCVWWQTILSFPVGVVFAVREDGLRAMISRHGVLVYSCGILLCVALFLADRIAGGLHSVFYDLRLVSLGPLTALVFYLVPARFGKPFRWLGAISFEIYLLHCVFERGLAPYIAEPHAYCVATIGATVALAFVVHRVDTVLISAVRRIVLR